MKQLIQAIIWGILLSVGLTAAQDTPFTRFEVGNPAIIQIGGWTEQDSDAASAGTYFYSGDVDSALEFTFTGEGFGLTYLTFWNFGIFDLYLNGEYLTSIDAYSVDSAVMTFPTVPLVAGTYTLRIQNTPQANLTSQGNYIAIDAIDVIGSGVAVSETVPLDSALQYPLLFTSDRTGNYDVYLSDGQGIRNISNSPEDERFLSLSADGTRLLVDTDPGFIVYDMNPDGSLTRFYQDTSLIRFATLSPDGQKVAYLFSGGMLGVMNVDGTNPTDLTPLVRLATTPNEAITISSIESPSWSPDSSRILITVDDLSKRTVMHLAIDGSQANALIGIPHPDAGVVGSVARWSPDGQSIAFICAADLCVSDLLGTNIINLTNTPEIWEYYPPAWTPDSEGIAFVSQEAEGNRIYGIPRNGGERTLLSYQNGNSSTWSPDGKTIAFNLFVGEGEFTESDIGLAFTGPDGNPFTVNLTNSPGNDINPIWLPHAESSPTETVATTPTPNIEPLPNQRLAFIGQEGSSTEIYSIAPDGGARHQLTNTPTINEDNLVASADGRWLAYTVAPNVANVEAPPNEIWLMLSDGSNAHLWASAMAWSLKWSPDGRGIVYESDTPQAIGDYFFGNYPTDVYWLEVGNSTPQNLTASLRLQYPDYAFFKALTWSHDSQRLLIAADNVDIDYQWHGSGLFWMGLEGIIQPIDFEFNSQPIYAAQMPTDEILVEFYNSPFTNVDLAILDAQGQGRNLFQQTLEDRDKWVWSPDGAKSAFLSSQYYDNQEIYVSAEDTAQKITNSPADEIALAWSLDGQYLAFTSVEDATAFDAIPSIGVIQPDGRHQQILATAAHSPVWIIGGESESTVQPSATIEEPTMVIDDTQDQLVMFQEHDDDTHSIYLMSLGGTQITRVSDHQLTHLVHWSPDGQTMLYASVKGPLFFWQRESQISSEFIPLTPPPVGGVVPWGWSPGGKFTAYAANPRPDQDALGAYTQLWIIGSGGEPELDIGDLLAPYHPELFQIADVQWLSDSNLMVVTAYLLEDEIANQYFWADVEEGRIVALSADSIPQWSPNKTQYAFLSGGKLYQSSINGTPVLLSGELSDVKSPSWSPHNEQIAFIVAPSDETLPHQIYRVQADGTGLQLLPTPEMQITSQLVWVQEGRALVFAGSSPHGQGIYRINADGSGLTLLNTNDNLPPVLGLLALSPSGKWITWWRDGTYVVNVEDGSLIIANEILGESLGIGIDETRLYNWVSFPTSTTAINLITANLSAYQAPNANETLTRISGQIQREASPEGATLSLIDSQAHVTLIETDAEGHFSHQWELGKAGIYRLYAEASGHLPLEYQSELTSGQELILPAAQLIAGDVNGDLVIDILDVVQLGVFWGQYIESGSPTDLNGDAIIDIQDLILVGNNYGRQGVQTWVTSP